jgi:hypothetical protein
MSEGNAAPAATPSGFQSLIRSNLAAAAPSQPGVVASNGPPATSAQQPPAMTTLPAPTQNDATLDLPPQQPANDNAQQAQDGTEQAEDPWTRQLHGVPVRELVEALERGELPEAVLTAIKGIAKVGGKELPVSLREALNGYMRLTDHTQKTQELARFADELDQSKAQMRGLFEGWEKPEVYAQAMERMGMIPQARAMVTREWGTAEQPNVQGYMESMRRLGHWDTFRKAAEAYAGWYDSRLQAFNPARTQEGHQRAAQMIAELEREQGEHWKARLQAETVTEQAKREQWKREREQMLAQRRQQNPQQQHAQLAQHVHGLRNQELLGLGIINQQSTAQYVEAVNQRFEAAMGQLVQIASRDAARNPQAPREPIESLVQKAAQIVAEHIGEAPKPPQQQAAPQQQGLPPRPGGAPTTSGAGAQKPMSPREFEARLRSGGR